MRRTWLTDAVAASGIAVLAAAAGGAGAVYTLGRGAEDRRAVLAECGFAAGGEILGSTLRLRCGLEQAQIERLFADALQGLNLDGLADGRAPSEAQLQAAGERLGLVAEAVEALLAGLGDRGGAEGPAQPVDWAIEVDLREDGQDPDGAVPVPVRFSADTMTVGRASTEAEAILLDRVEAKCGAAVGEAISSSVIEIDCGPEPEEVQALIDRFVDASGAADIRAALAADSAARTAFIRDLSASFGLRNELVAALVAELADQEVADETAAATLDETLRARMHQALLLLRIGQTAELLGARQAALAEAIVAGDAAEAERLAQEVAGMLRPLADDLAPEPMPWLVAAAWDADAAAERIAALDFGAGVRDYLAAADAARAARWPLMALDFELAAAQALSDPRAADVPGTLAGEGDPASRIWLDVADHLRDEAVDLGLAAARRLATQGEHALGDELLARSSAILARLEPLVPAEQDPGRRAALLAQRATLHRFQARRTGDFAQLQEAGLAADAALALAEELGEEAHIGHLMTWAIMQLELGRWTGDRAHIDRALEGFERVAASRSADEDPVGWAWAENNVAVALQDKALLENDTGTLRKAADTYRRIAARMDPSAHPDEWTTYTRNLAITLVGIGGREGSAAPVRSAISELEKLRAFEADRPVGLAAGDTLEKLAQAWWQIGYVERDTGAYDTAAAIMRDAVEVYPPDTAARFRVGAELQLGDILREAGEVWTDPSRLAAAAETYGAARATAEASGQPLLEADATLRQARALHGAAALEAEPDGAPDPKALVAEAIAILAHLSPEDSTQAAAVRLGAEADRLAAELGTTFDQGDVEIGTAAEQ